MSRKGVVVLSIVLLLVAMSAGCGATPEPTAPPQPAVAEEVALKITGQVTTEMAWTEEAVRAMDTMKAQSIDTQGEIQTYTGVSIKELLALAGPAGDATTLVFVGGDGSGAEVALADIEACADCIVSFRNKGGFSIVAPGFPGDVQVKGVVEIQVK